MVIIMKTKLKPNQSLRFCMTCDKETRFELNKAINHSECIECGCRYANKINKQNNK
jgi:hypothetical protein